MFRSLLKQQEHLQVKTEETRLACFQCFCLHCQITLLFSPGCPNWSCIAWDCPTLHAFWALFPYEPNNFYNTKLSCGENLLFQHVQMEAVIRQNCSILQWQRKWTWPAHKGEKSKSDSRPMLYAHRLAFKTRNTSFSKGQKNPTPNHTLI